MIKSTLTACVVFACGIALAQAQGVPNPFSGMGRDSDKPIAIAADSTTADLRSETATYAGNVRVEQGNLKMRSDSLAIKASKGAILRIEAKGNVVLASPQGHATGANAIYDIADRVVRMSGKVILAQGPNILRGSSLVINLATGRAELTLRAARAGAWRACSCRARHQRRRRWGLCPPPRKNPRCRPMKRSQRPDTSRKLKAKWDFMRTFNE